MAGGPMGEYDARKARTDARARALDRAREQSTYLDSRLEGLEEQIQRRTTDDEGGDRDVLEKGLLEVAAAVNRLTVVIGSRD